MIRRTIVVIVVLALASIAAAAPKTPKTPTPPKGEVTLSGTVQRAVLTSEGKVKRVYVATADWGALLVTRTPEGKDLVQHVNARVEVTGVVKRAWDQEQFEYLIDVAAFKVLPPETEDAVPVAEEE